MPIAINDETGETLYLDPGGKWAPAPKAVHEQTGETLIYDGQSWLPSKGGTRQPQQQPQVPQAKTTAPGAFGRIGAEIENVMSAAEQRTTPNIGAQMPNLLGEATIDEEGNVLAKTPTGLVPTDQRQHVVLDDPSTGKKLVFQRTEQTAEGPATGVARVLSTGLGGPGPVTAGRLATARPVVTEAAKAAIKPTASDIFSAAKPHFREFKETAKQIDITSQAGGIAERLRGALKESNFIPKLAEPVYSAIEILEEGKPLTLDVMQNVKRVVGKSFASPDKNVRDAAAVASGEINKIIAEASPEAAQALRAGDEIHATALAVQDLQRKEAIAGLRAGRAGYGGNAVNTMRQVLSPVVQKSIEGRKTLFKPDEISAMRDIVEGTTATNIARGIGMASPSKGGIQTGGALGATIFLGPKALLIPAIGAASNKLATILTGRQIAQLKDLVAKRTPAYAEAVKRAVDRFEKAQADFVIDPSPPKLGGYIAASRALSSGLTRDGISVTSGDLLRSIQGPVRGGAEEEQQNPEGIVNQ